MKEKLQKGFLTLRKYWSRPQKGQFVAYKEIAGFSIGGMGVKSFASLLTFMNLAATVMFTAIVYGLSPNEIMILFLITNVGVGVLKTPIISWLQDKTNTPIGKFRPYLIWAGIPCVLAVIGVTWLVPIPGWILPAGQPNKALTMTMLCIFLNIFIIAQQLLNNAYMGISQTISPLSSERTKIMGFSEFLGNLGPSIIQAALPICGLCFATKAEAMTNVWTYRVFMPIFAIIGFGLGLIVLYTSKERTTDTDSMENIKAKETKENKLSFFTSLKLLSKNKEFWLVTISKFFDGFKGWLTLLLPWICAFQLQNTAIQGVVQTIVSFGFTPGIILAPLLIKWLGSRGSGIIFHALNAAAALLMLFTYKSGVVVMLICLFLFNFALGPQYIIQNTIMSDGFDFQQDRDNVRLEGFAQNFQLMISTLGTVASTLAFTIICNKYNVGTVTNANADYSMLIDPAIRNPFYGDLILLVVIASACAAIPFIFVTLNRNKMAVIRENLDRKKVIADNHLENATPEEIEAAYNSFLEKQEAEHLAEVAIAEKEKARIEEKAAAEREEKQAYIAELEALKAQIISNGGSKKDAEKAVREKEKARNLELKAKRKEALANIVAEQKALAARKKVFVADWKVTAKAEHEEIVAKAKIDIANAKAEYAQKLDEYKKLLGDKEIVNQYKAEVAQIKAACKEKTKIYKAEKLEKRASEIARFEDDKATIASLKQQLVSLKEEQKVKVAEYNDNYNKVTCTELANLEAKLKVAKDDSAKAEITASIKEMKKAAKAEKRSLTKEYKCKKAELTSKIDRINFAHSSAISQISIDFNTKKDALKKEIATANKLKAMKKQIVQDKNNAIVAAKHKSQSIKLWLNVLAKEAFEKQLFEEALNAVNAE